MLKRRIQPEPASSIRRRSFFKNTYYATHYAWRNKAETIIRWCIFFFIVLYFVDWTAQIIYTTALPHLGRTSEVLLMLLYAFLIGGWYWIRNKPHSRLRFYYQIIVKIIAYQVRRTLLGIKQLPIIVQPAIYIRLLSIGLYSINATNALRAPFNVLIDPVLIVVNPLVEILHPPWAKMYHYRVDHGMRWKPQWLQPENSWYASISVSGSDQVIFKRLAYFAPEWYHAAETYDTPTPVLFGINGQETAGLFGRLPECDQKHGSYSKLHTMSCAGGTELGLTHMQAGLCKESWLPKRFIGWLTLDFFIVANRRTDMMSKNGVYNDHLEFQRSKFMVFLCGFKLPKWLDYARYYFISSIEDRLSSKIFSHTARYVSRYAHEAKKSKPPTTDDWYKHIFSRWSGHGRNSTAVSNYLRKGIGYITWEKEHK